MKLIKGNERSGDAKETREIKQRIEAEKKRGRGGITGEGRVLLEDDELRIIDDSEDANSRRSLSSVQLPESHRNHSQVQSLGQVCWERFLPVGSPKVLLVESDDSTRHVVTALLRNCSYEVIAVSNGSEAWKILEDLNNQIDLVLTEVVMSGLSGIGLLSKIMSHKSCQNIPVIMMSTHDSMGIVLKCLSKGAADYLVKPIRKNELKNLWQHVWRRCHSSSGSGSESCTRNENCTGTKCAEKLGNVTDSDYEDGNRSIGLQARDGSDNGSGTQSSWTKRAAEVESPQPLSASDQATEPPDSTCAQVIYPMPEAFSSSWMLGASKEHDKQDIQLDNVPMGKDLEIGVPNNTDAQQNAPNKKPTVENNKCSLLDLNLKNDGQSCDDENMEMSNDNPKGEWIKQAMSLPREVPGNNEHHQGSMLPDEPPLLTEISKTKDKAEQHAEDLPSLELSLKRLGDDQNILGHSQVSTFTRYNTGSTGNQSQTADVGSCSPPNNSSKAAKQSNSDPPNQISNSSSNYNKGSTTNRSFTKPALPTDTAPGKSTVHCSHNPSVFQPVQNGHKVNAGSVNAGALQENDTGNQQIKIQYHHHHHHHHHHNHNVHSVQQLQNLPAQDEISKSMDRNGTETLQCGSSNNCRAPTLANVANCSLNGSASGSNNGSNFINGSSAVVNEGTNLVDDSGIAAKDGGVDNGNGSGSGSGSGSGVGVDQNRSAQREAALNKFRLKRKERCFDKRVRYQSRKKLADQRPRVRGQFVRQVQENKGKMEIANPDSSNKYCCPDYYGTSNMPV